MSSTRQGYLAYIKETTTPVALTPTHFVRFESGDIELNQETIINSPIQNNRAKAISPLAGKVNASGSYEFSLDVNECPFPLYAALGSLSAADVSSATDGSVYTHTITVANSLPSFTIEQGKANIADTSNDRQNYIVSRAYGAMCDSFKMSGSDEKIMLTTDWKAHGVFHRAKMISDAAAGSAVAISVESAEGLVASDIINIYDTDQAETNSVGSLSLSANTVTIATLANTFEYAKNGKIELRPLTPSYGTAPKVMMFHHLNYLESDTVSNALSATQTDIEDWELEFKNNMEQRFGSLRQSPAHVDVKGYEAKLTFTRYFENVADRDNYLNLTQRGVVLDITDNTIVSATDTAELKNRVRIKIHDARFTSWALPTGNDDVYAAKTVVDCFYNTSDGATLTIEVTNGNAGTVYTA